MFLFHLATIFCSLYTIHATCTFPTDIQNTYESSHNGEVVFNSTHMYYDVYGKGTQSFECYMTTGTKYIGKSEAFQVFNDYIYAVICFDITSLKTSLYQMQIYTTKLSDANYQRVKYVQTTTTITDAVACDDNANTETSLLMEKDTLANQTIQCPDDILGQFSITFNGTDCLNDTGFLDVCTDTTMLTYNYTTCDTKQAYSDGGNLNCIYSTTDGTTTSLYVYNLDSTTDESTYYRFTCFKMMANGSQILATQHPQDCLSTQTATSVDGPGATLTMSPNYTCVPTTTSTTEETTMAAVAGASTATIAGAVVAGFIILLLIGLFIGYCIYVKKFKKDRVEPRKGLPPTSTGQDCEGYDVELSCSDTQPIIPQQERRELGTIQKQPILVSSCVESDVVQHQEVKPESKPIERGQTGIGMRREVSFAENVEWMSKQYPDGRIGSARPAPLYLRSAKRVSKTSHGQRELSISSDWQSYSHGILRQSIQSRERDGMVNERQEFEFDINIRLKGRVVSLENLVVDDRAATAKPVHLKPILKRTASKRSPNMQSVRDPEPFPTIVIMKPFDDLIYLTHEGNGEFAIDLPDSEEEQYIEGNKPELQKEVEKVEDGEQIENIEDGEEEEEAKNDIQVVDVTENDQMTYNIDVVNKIETTENEIVKIDGKSETTKLQIEGDNNFQNEYDDVQITIIKDTINDKNAIDEKQISNTIHIASGGTQNIICEETLENDVHPPVSCAIQNSQEQFSYRELTPLISANPQHEPLSFLKTESRNTSIRHQSDENPVCKKETELHESKQFTRKVDNKELKNGNIKQMLSDVDKKVDCTKTADECESNVADKENKSKPEIVNDEKPILPRITPMEYKLEPDRNVDTVQLPNILTDISEHQNDTLSKQIPPAKTLISHMVSEQDRKEQLSEREKTRTSLPSFRGGHSKQPEEDMTITIKLESIGNQLKPDELLNYTENGDENNETSQGSITYPILNDKITKSNFTPSKEQSASFNGNEIHIDDGGMSCNEDNSKESNAVQIEDESETAVKLSDYQPIDSSEAMVQDAQNIEKDGVPKSDIANDKLSHRIVPNLDYVRERSKINSKQSKNITSPRAIHTPEEILKTNDVPVNENINTENKIKNVDTHDKSSDNEKDGVKPKTESALQDVDDSDVDENLRNVDLADPNSLQRMQEEQHKDVIKGKENVGMHKKEREVNKTNKSLNEQNLNLNLHTFSKFGMRAEVRRKSLSNENSDLKTLSKELFKTKSDLGYTNTSERILTKSDIFRGETISGANYQKSNESSLKIKEFSKGETAAGHKTSTENTARTNESPNNKDRSDIDNKTSTVSSTANISKPDRKNIDTLVKGPKIPEMKNPPDLLTGARLITPLMKRSESVAKLFRENEDKSVNKNHANVKPGEHKTQTRQEVHNTKQVSSSQMLAIKGKKIADNSEVKKVTKKTSNVQTKSEKKKKGKKQVHKPKHYELRTKASEAKVKNSTDPETTELKSINYDKYGEKENSLRKSKPNKFRLDNLDSKRKSNKKKIKRLKKKSSDTFALEDKTFVDSSVKKTFKDLSSEYAQLTDNRVGDITNVTDESDAESVSSIGSSTSVRSERWSSRPSRDRRKRVRRKHYRSTSCLSRALSIDSDSELSDDEDPLLKVQRRAGSSARPSVSGDIRELIMKIKESSEVSAKGEDMGSCGNLRTDSHCSPTATQD